MDEAALDTWLETPEPGWIPASLPHHELVEDGFVSGQHACRWLTIRYYQRTSDGALVGKVRFDRRAQGPPGHAHGGSIAALLDDLMGGAAWFAGHPVVAAELTTRFRNMLPLGAPCMIEAVIASVSGRKIKVEGRIQSTDGVTFAEGEALFIRLSDEVLNNLGFKASEG